jgi:cyclopropane fatty-acyl-phospholipid synthase-like methyltransferase
MSFDFLAPHYRWMEAVLAGKTLQRARLRWIDALEGRERVVMVGEGPGRLLEVLLRRFPRTEVTVVELSGAMIDVAQRRLRAKGVSLERVRWIQADIRSWSFEDGRDRGEGEDGSVRGKIRFDAVITPFVLDCFSSEDLTAVIERLSASAKVDAVWLVADFQVPKHGWRRWRARVIHRIMYCFFRVATELGASRLTEPDEALARAGFALKARAVFNAGLVRSDWWARGG